MSTKVITGKCRFSYVSLFNKNQNDKYSVTLLIPKSDKTTMDRIRAALTEAKESCGPLFGGKVPANLASPVHDGDGEKPKGGEYGPECAGCWVINASCKTKPGIVDREKNEILDSSEVYSGCYGRASVSFYAFNTNGNRGLACGLNNVQKLSDGPMLGGRSRAEDDFDDWTEDDGDDGLGF